MGGDSIEYNKILWGYSMSDIGGRLDCRRSILLYVVLHDLVILFIAIAARSKGANG